jgi:hypothetical protein
MVNIFGLAHAIYFKGSGAIQALLPVVPTVVMTVLRTRNGHRNKYSTYVGDSMKHLWIGIGISFFVLSFVISSTRGGWLIAYSFIILFYSLGTLIGGMFLRCRPLIIGGIFNWVLACICVFLPYDYQLLTATAAILTSYIISGHIIQPNRK